MKYRKIVVLIVLILAVLMIIWYLRSKSMTSSPHLNSHQVTFSQIDQLPLGVAKDFIEKNLGKPSEIIKLPQRGGIVNWRYYVGSEMRAILALNETSGVLLAKVWDVLDGDSEQKIETALNRFPHAHFKKRELKWVNPHVAPDEFYYEDRKLGISIKVREARQEVSAISWFAPGTPPPPEPTCIKYQKENGLMSCKPQQ